MWTYCRCIVVVTLTFAFQGSLPDMCRAGITFLGPTPYLSAADSPFPVDGSNSDFYLEDFEDGELNTPGIRQRNVAPIFGDAALAKVMPPSPQTDSVDGDDGLIDGIGNGGVSLRTSVAFEAPLLPPIVSFVAEVEFDENTLGYFPNAFGIVWTDGPEGSSFSLHITTGLGDSFSTPSTRDIGDATRNGGTAEDFFVGAVVPSGIVSVRISGSTIGDLPAIQQIIEVDHLQYGFIVPEPPSLSGSLGLLGLVFLSGEFRVRNCCVTTFF